VVQLVLGDAYQVACNLGKPDKCAAVHRDFGSFEGCDDDLCLDGLDGANLEGCGGGARVGRGRVLISAARGGGTLNVIHIHGTSGILPADQECRVRQIDQIFVDGGDGLPLADGERNVIMGDFNTDPGRQSGFDASAERWLEVTGDAAGFTFVTEAGSEAMPTYANLVNIDHVVADAWTGGCVHPGLSATTSPVVDYVYFDHVPALCDLVPIR
jgi:endonuclease/exonuclease/phosphatase family metal-dependent hydrolase